jgi:hypothetical protein
MLVSVDRHALTRRICDGDNATKIAAAVCCIVREGALSHCKLALIVDVVPLAVLLTTYFVS